MKPFWTTLDGTKIKYEDLTDDHLKAIIKDGYRNPYIIEEASKRNFNIPLREIDKLDLKNFFNYLETFSSCAIEGNTLAKILIDLYNNKDPKFEFYFNRYLENLKEFENE